MVKKALIVDDDRKLLALVKEYLEGYDFQVVTLQEGEGVVRSLRSETPDIVILDIMLPGKNGLDVLKDIRRESTIPVIMLTAKGEDADRIVGLELGADDYLPKPFNPRELLARMKAVLRRLHPDERNASQGEESGMIRSGEIALNRAKQTLLIQDREVELSHTEYKLLEALMLRPNRVLSRDKLMSLARGRDFMAFDRSIDVHISKLRAKVETDPKSPRRIKTVWGSGYMFVDGI